VSIRDRLGFDAGGMGLEDALAWAARHDFHYVDFNADQPPNALNAWDEARVRTIRQQCERHAIHLGLHTLSGVNVAEFSPYVSAAVDAYLRANIDVAHRLGCAWLVVHASFHFSANVEARQAAALACLQRSVVYAEQIGPRRLLENLNLEPAKEVHLNPGEGNIDFAALFQRLESSGYPYHYMMAFGSLADKLAGRDRLAACCHEA
jgi:sugar phosphate isomerase/epimerase